MAELMSPWQASCFTNTQFVALEKLPFYVTVPNQWPVYHQRVCLSDHGGGHQEDCV